MNNDMSTAQVHALGIDPIHPATLYAGTDGGGVGSDSSFDDPPVVAFITRASTDTVGVFRPSNGVIFLKNKNETGFAEVDLNYGLAGDMQIAGNWDGAP